MLSALHIENIAVVKSLDVDFSYGMTVLSGETGAGKSIIIDSLGLLLGMRADKELIRSGEDRAEVSAVFEGLPDSATALISELGFDSSEGSIMISRSVSTAGSSARINGRAVTLSVLREVSGVLFNIHGQNDNQQLLDPDNHVEIIDSYAKNSEIRGEYSEIYREILHKRNEIDSLRRDRREQERLSEMLRFQIADIDGARLKRGEEEVLEQTVAKLRSMEQIIKCCTFVQKALEGSEKTRGAIYLTERAAAAMDNVSDALPEAESISERLNDIKYELADIAESMSALYDFGGEDPSTKLDRAEARLHTIGRLKKKYGNSVEEILDFRAEATARLSDMENADGRIEELTAELEALEARANALAKSLSERRRNLSRELTKKITETLAFLDMPKVRFDVGIEKTEDFGATGKDCVEFLISTNPGEPLMPMAKIASGGELARIMLSLKNVLNECDGIDTVIFDEIDTGISGKTSRKVGIKLKEISAKTQVICVTHSAQIASMAHNHFHISKTEVDGRAETRLRLLDRDGREEEIARILGGIEITEAQRSAAREMIADGENYR
ncbi:MAG: DNA repair protein RecN [Ruminococcaceae bacterium]|nr:DNA repair protein RecN [Oscillospiraceae bacterium]